MRSRRKQKRHFTGLPSLPLFDSLVCRYSDPLEFSCVLPGSRGPFPLPGRRGLWYITPSKRIVFACLSWFLAQVRPGLREDCIVATTEERVIQIVCDNLGVNKEQVTRATKFQEDIGADSLDIVELVMELEEEFEITIPDEAAEKIKTVGEAIEYIDGEIKKK